MRDHPVGAAIDAGAGILYISHADGNFLELTLGSEDVVDGASIPRIEGSIVVDSDHQVIYAVVDQGGSNSDAFGGFVAVLEPRTGLVSHTIPVGEGPGGMFLEPTSGRLYVANYGGTITVIDTVERRAIKTIDLGTWGTGPVDVVADENAIYASGQRGDVHVIDAVSLELKSVVTIPSGGSLGSLAIDPSTGTVFALHDAEDGSLYALDTGNLSVRGPLALERRPADIVVDPLAGVAYVANAGSDSVLVVDTRQFEVSHRISVGASPRELAIDLGTGTIYVVNATGASLSVLGPG